MEYQFYSQCGEDEFIFKKFVDVHGASSKTYLEMGALDGIKYSNTKFYDESLGWNGILIEPHPEDFKRLKANRPHARHYNKVVSNSKDPVDYSYFNSANLSAVSGITDTLTPNHLAQFFENDDPWYKKMREESLCQIKLTPVSLDWVLSDAQVDELFLCSIDVEGHELNVLQSYSFDLDITMFLIEIGPNDEQITKLMIQNGYSLWGPVAHNNLYITNKRQDLLSVTV